MDLSEQEADRECDSVHEAGGWLCTSLAFNARRLARSSRAPAGGLFLITQLSIALVATAHASYANLLVTRVKARR